MPKKTEEIEKIITEINNHLDIATSCLISLEVNYNLFMPTIPDKINELKRTINEMKY